MFLFNSKTPKPLLLILLHIALVFLLTTAVCDAKFDVYVIYFKPIDAIEIDRDYHDKILRDIQGYYQSEMTRHGFTDKTFPLEFDKDDGKLVIHTIDGKHKSDNYDISDNYDANDALKVYELIQSEFPFRFDNNRNIESRDNVYLVIMGGIDMKNDWRGGPAMGRAWHGGRWGGNAIETMDRKKDFPNHYLAVVAHELGHAFGLDPGHNGVQQAFNGNEIAWGRTTAEWGDRMSILDFEAALLDSRPIFRKMELPEDPPKVNKNEDLNINIGTDEDVEKTNGDSISVSAYSKITLKWADLKLDH